MKKKWHVADITRLRLYYLESRTLAVMSDLLGHSPSAINKCLTRFNIRPRLRHQFFHLRKQRAYEQKLLPPPDVEAVKAQVLDYARTVLRMPIQALGPDQYRLKHAILTFNQLLFHVNTHRIRQTLLPFVLD